MMQWIGVLGCLLLAHGCGNGVGELARAQPANAVLDIKAINQLVADQKASQDSLRRKPEALAWKWFLMLNDPLVGPAPKLWEGWKQTSDGYLSDGSRPLPWRQNPPLPASVKRKAKDLGLDLNKPFHNLDSELQVDGLTLRDVFQQDVRYQLLMNEDTFHYILGRGLYNVDGQERLAKTDTPANFPPTSWELKNSWIWIGDDRDIYNQLKGTYYIVNAYFQNKKGKYEVGKAALTGMHIINKLIPDWVWVTFENVNNENYTVTNSEPPEPMTNQLPISAAAELSNTLYQQALCQLGSIVANYQVIGVQYQFVDASGQATLLANSQIESAFQRNSSCITCHGIASYSVTEGYFNLVKSPAGDILYYTGKLPEDKLKGYTSLDFVWSLKRASREGHDHGTE